MIQDFLGSIVGGFKILLISLLFWSCHLARIPKEKLPPYQLGTDYEFRGDSLIVELSNPLRCPMRIWIQAEDQELKNHFRSINPINLAPLQDTQIVTTDLSTENREINFASRFGDIHERVKADKVELPFKKNESYRLIQGYNSKPTHNTDWSSYALDFGLAVGDTVCAATAGYVVGLVQDYRYGGEDEKWRDYANFITIYDSTKGLFTQYVHLDYNGSLVKLGDKVEAGQQIAISGKTGYTNVEHLHFNCLKAVHSEKGLISIPVEKIGIYRTVELKRNQMVKN